MKLGILTATWKRYDVFKIYCKAINRYREHPELEIVPLVVVSDRQSAAICRNNKIKYITCPNFPLSSKFQAGMTELKKYGVDYVLNLGSDDLICDNTLNVYLREMNKGFDFIGVGSCFVYSRVEKKLVYWPGYSGWLNYRKGESAGVARCLSARLLNFLNWKVWDCDINKGLDGCMTKRLKGFKYSSKTLFCENENMMVVDLKDNQSVTNFKHYKNCRKIDNKAIDYFLPNEATEIKNS